MKNTTSTQVTRRRIGMGVAALCTLALAACGGGSSSSTTGGGNDTTGTGAYEAAKPFPSGSCLLWKPVSEIDHGLVVLVPAGMSNQPPIIRDATGKVIASGREHVDARGHNKCNGIRYHWVFGKGKGANYPKPSILSIGGNNYQIPNPAGRYD